DVDAGLIDTLMQRLRVALTATAPEARGTPVLVRGTFGPDAGALGAATLPMFFNFSPRAGILMGAGAQANVQAQEVSHVAH
ncbi:MAG: N-acylmannosamine kinase, partial [Paraburkholderia sp.]